MKFQANILLVDDRQENLMAMKTILADLEQNLICVTSGREALRFLLHEEVALILLDVQMPGLNGFELAELIRERERTQRTPIIFISAISKNEQYIFRGYSLGAVDYLTKPFDSEILKSKVRFFTELFHQNQEIKRQAILLEQTNAELDSLNAELESRVRQRTTQLEKANRELENEIATRKQSEARLATEHSITLALADSDSLETAASRLLKAFCEHLKVNICCLWLLNKSGKTLDCVQIETTDKTDEINSFIAETRKTRISLGSRLPGQVWGKNAPIWLTDRVNSEEFPRVAFAQAIGLNYAIGFPIKIGREFYGVIELFTQHQLLSDPQLLNMLEAIGSEIGQFIERKLVEVERENLLLREKSLREQAETANRLKDEFLATVSHELRTPLNSILGWGQMLQSGILSAEERDNALEKIYRNARSQAKLIDDLLDISRLITGNLSLNLSPTSVLQIIKSAIEVIRPAAEIKTIQISTVYDSGDETIICDPQRLQQMVWNLLTNAVKFTPNNGQIEVRLEQIQDWIKIIVSDTGQGISPKFLPFVFDRFRQADSSSTRTHDGLGLGLAIVRHLAEQHGGSVQAHSDGHGKGAVFTITLPRSQNIEDFISVAKEDENGFKPGADFDPELIGIRVLIVDDDIDTCEMLRFALNQYGAEAKTSTSVSEAMLSITKWHPDILLTDINMPDEDGYMLIKKLRALPTENGANIPAIALTALARPEDSEQALSSGFHLHLVKPVDIQELAQAIVGLTKNYVGSGNKI